MPTPKTIGRVTANILLRYTALRASLRISQITMNPPMQEIYAGVREYLRAVRAGNPKQVRRVLRNHRSLLEEEETLLAPIYFQKPDVARAVMEEVSRLFGRRRFHHQGLYGLLHWFGEARTKELERAVLRFLRHRRSDMRYIALNVLT